jgi:hypothetical protein
MSSMFSSKIEKLEKLQQELAQIATWGIFTKKQQGHIDLEDNFYVLNYLGLLRTN